MMSTWLPETDEIRKKAQAIVDQNLKEKEKYIEEKRGGSISEENIQFLADGVFANKTKIENIIRTFTYVPWDSSQLTDEQVLGFIEENPNFQKYLSEQEEVQESMVSTIDREYIEANFDEEEIEDGEWWWQFESEEEENKFWISHARTWIAQNCEDHDQINSFEDLYEPLSNYEDFENGFYIEDKYKK